MVVSSLTLWAILAVGAIPAAQRPDRLVVENEYLALAVERAARGSVTSLVDKTTGRELIAPSNQAPLFRLDYSIDGDPRRGVRTIHAAQAERVELAPWSSRGERGVQVTFAGFDRRTIEIVCTIFTDPGERLARCRLEARLPKDVTLESIVYPIVSVRLPLASDRGCRMVVGSGGGGVLRPDQWKVGTTYRFEQPGRLAAGFGCYYDDVGGLYTAAYDGAGFRKALFFTRRTSDSMEVGWQHPCFERNSHALSYEIVLGGFSSPEADRAAEWRDAADIYKLWAVRQAWCRQTFAERRDLPKWLKEGPAMVRFTRAWLSQPGWIDAWLSDYWRKEFPARRPLVVAYWGWEKVGKWIGPDYFPAYPSDERFRHLVALGRQMGAHAFVWPSGYHYSLGYGRRLDGSYLWDNRASLESEALSHVVIQRDGQPAVRDCIWLRGGQQATLCPGDTWTIDWLNRAAIECARRGVELVQIDQVVGGNFPVCYSTVHGHKPGPGQWATDAFGTQLRTMAAQCRTIEPDSVVGFEQPNEWFLQQVSIQDYRDCDVLWAQQEPASVFAYLYHEYMPTLFQSNRPQTGHDPLGLAWCLVHGQIPHFAARIGIGRGSMLIDGGFELASDEGPVEMARTMWFPGDRWSGGETEIDHSEPHSGRSCLRLFNLSSQDRALAAQNFEVNEGLCTGKPYRFSLWMRGRDIAEPRIVHLVAFAPGMTPLRTWDLACPTNQTQWARAEVDFVLPAGSCTLRLMLHLDGPGVVWLDDLRFDQVSADGTLTEVQRPERPTDHEFMRQWVELFQGAGRPYLLLGRMLHPPPLRTEPAVAYGGRSFAPVMHNAFQAPDGSRAVILANWTARQQHAELTWKNRSIAIDLAPSEVRLIAD